MNRKLLIFLILAIISAVAIFSSYYFISLKKKANFKKLNQEGIVSLSKGSYGNAEDQFKKALETAYDNKTEMLSKYNLALTYLATYPPKGITLLKDISTNNSYDPQTRASAINSIVTYYIGTRDKVFAKEVIFKGDTWGSFLENDDFSLAVRRASEWSISLYSNFLGEYRVAIWYIARWRNGEASDKEKDSFLNLIKERLRNGNKALLSAETDKNKDAVGFGYIYKGNILEFLNQIKEIDATDDQIIEAYSSAISILKSDPSNLQARVKLPYASFSLAAFLSRKGGENDREIKNLMDPVYEMQSKYFDSFLFSVKEPANINSRIVYEDILRLAGIDNRFKDYLSQRGWKI